MHHSFSQCPSLSRSFCRVSASLLLDIVRYAIVSSAKSLTVDVSHILYPLQHGFRKGHSCEAQLIEFVDDISKNLQEGQQTDILILDFAKVFDSITTDCFLFASQFCIHLTDFSMIP
jgi:hypothetical protein